ncbi:MAG: hypothetical protein A2Y81_05705 [Nitrospirae bacterium RBG_13_43_8]|nr:MAG: hypothetical protein A2Y81_05705 [Nitrospirae bacterium RBG_13_43_8]
MMPSEKFRWCAMILVGAIVLIYFSQLAFPAQAEYFVLDSSKIMERPWTVLTYMLLHGSFSHLFFNMFALALFGSMLEAIVGWKNFLIVFFSTGIFSGIVSVFFYSGVLGASGAIFGVLGVLGMIRPKMGVLAMGVPMPMVAAIIIWAALDLFGVFYPDQTAHFGHLAGLVFGLIVGLLLRKKYKIIEKKEKKFVLTDDEFKRWEETYMGKG